MITKLLNFSNAAYYRHSILQSQMYDLAKEDKKKVATEMTFQMFLRTFLFDKDCQYGRYFEYVEYMWSLRDNPNLLIVYFEDLKRVSLILVFRYIVNTIVYDD